MRFTQIIGIGLAALVLAGCGGNGGHHSITIQGHLYLTDSTNARLVSIKTMSGGNWTTFGSYGTGTGQFEAPQGIAFDTLGRIYVADRDNNRIVRIDDMSGAGWTTLGTLGSGSMQFDGPERIAFDSSGRMYVSDSGNDRIVRVDDMSGAGWTTFGTSGDGVGEFDGPIAIGIDSNDRIYIGDAGNSRMARIDDMTGTNWTELGNTSDPGVFYVPVDVAFDDSGHMYVVDSVGRLVRTGLMSTTGWTTLNVQVPQGISLGPSGEIYTTSQVVDHVIRYNSFAGDGAVTYGGFGDGTGTFFTLTDAKLGP